MTQNASHTIARVFVDEVLECGFRANVDIKALLGDLDLSYGDLDRLTPQEFAKLWLKMSERMGDEFFGLGLRPMVPGSFTLMGHAVRDAETFDVALRRAIRFLAVVIGDPCGDLEIRDGRCTITLNEADGPRSAFAYRTYFLILHGLNCWLVRERIPILHIQFPCREPASGNDYDDFFGKPVVFGAKTAALSFHAKYLKRRVKRTEKELKVFLRTTPETFLRGYRPVLSLKRHILDFCREKDLSKMPTTEEIAVELGLSKSTLHRRLRDEGQSIRGIKEEIRRSRAAYLLKTTSMAINDVAQTVGYAEPSAFHRAFRKWYSTTPSKMRAKPSRK